MAVYCGAKVGYFFIFEATFHDCKQSMKILIGILFSFFLLISCQTAFSQTRYKKGDTLTVFYLEGIRLRKEAGIDAEIISRLNFGNKVKVVDENIGKLPFEDEFSLYYTIKGYWVLVETPAGRGYVFDGYLSRMRIAEDDYAIYGSEMGDVLPKMLQGVNAKKLHKKHKKNLGEYEQITYKNGWIEEIGTFNDCKYIKISVPNITFLEGLLLLKSLNTQSFAIHRDINNPNKYLFVSYYNSLETSMVVMELGQNFISITEYKCPLAWEDK